MEQMTNSQNIPGAVLARVLSMTFALLKKEYMAKN